jgi:tRNA(Ile)-lysidine synthase
VSGGGDSLALMLMAAEWAAARGVALRVATVDHGLRPEAAAEAAAVAARAAALGLPADTLRWTGWDGAGNLQAQARRARLALLGGWARTAGLSAVALGHTLDDQAETFLINLARGSGVDGLAAMPPAVRRDGVLWLRPLLGLRRTALRDWLAARAEVWADDPSNEDDRFLRVRARAALDALGPLGLDAPRLAATAGAMARARAALDAATAADWGEAQVFDPGWLTLPRRLLRARPDEIALRLLADALRRAAGRPYRPRLSALAAALSAARAGALGAGRTLHGAVMADRGDAIVIAREPAAAARAADAGAGGVWDGRFAVLGRENGRIGALGQAGERVLAAARAAGWAAPPVWRAAPRAARLAAPALWRGDALVCAPHAAYGHGLTVAAPPDAFVETGPGDHI